MDIKYKLYKIEKLEKWNKFISMFNSINVDMKDLLPNHYYNEWLHDLELADKEIKEKDRDLNYLEKFIYNQKVFGKLFPAKINGLSFRVFKELEKNDTIQSNLNSFKPRKGYAKCVDYDQVSTITGRLINTKSSPKILTLPSRCRKIFESRWQSNGDLLYVDFKTLEPRVIRKINGKESSDDIYNEISNTLEFEVDRVIIKRGIISTLYGLNSCIEGLSKDRSDKVLNATKEYFDLSSILNYASHINEIGCRNNFFGRPIWNINEDKENKLINNYVQSTAVDVALTYFSELVDKINIELCKPIFIIHDALVLDVHNDYKNEIVNIVNQGYNCSQLGYFPLEIEKLSETY